MFKFLHTADIHLDSPMLNLNRYDDAPRDEFRDATRRAFDNIVDLAISEKVRFMLIAGDLYDGDCDDFHTPRHFRHRMHQLREHGIRVFIVQGNHDAQSRLTRAFQLQLPDNVHLFSTSQPETVPISEIGVAIHGQGFAQRVVTEDLSRHYPDPVSGMINIGVLHTSCGHFEQHDHYAPSSIRGLSSKGYDYWALGHIHKPAVLAGPPWIIYPGNPQGRSVRETGPRGCVIVSVDGDRMTQKREDVDVVRWHVCEIDVADCHDGHAIMPGIRAALEQLVADAAGRSLAVRLVLTGRSPAHEELVRNTDYWERNIRVSTLDHFEEQVWLEKIRLKTATIDEPTSSTDSALEELVSQLRSAELGLSAGCELQADFEKMLAMVPSDARIERDEIDIDRKEMLASLVESAQELLVARLLGEDPS